jgi:uncharacterized coiled-coil protein SlyX
MTDQALKALQNHVRKDEPLSIEERLRELETWVAETHLLCKAHDLQIAELHNRIERLEGEMSLDKFLEDLTTGGVAIKRTLVDDDGYIRSHRIPPQEVFAKGDPPRS